MARRGGGLTRKFPLYAADPEIPSRIVRRIGFDEGERMATQGSFRRVKDSKTAEHIGYQIMPEHLRGSKDHV